MTRLLALPLLACLAACTYEPGGGQSSNDTFTYRSTAQLPQNVTVVNTCTGEKVATFEVPVGQQLVVKFLNRKNSEEGAQDVMRWEIMDWGRLNITPLGNQQMVPPASCRRLDVSYRAIPESTRVVPKAPEPIVPPPASTAPAARPAQGATPASPPQPSNGTTPSERPAIPLPQ